MMLYFIGRTGSLGLVIMSLLSAALADPFGQGDRLARVQLIGTSFRRKGEKCDLRTVDGWQNHEYYTNGDGSVGYAVPLRFETAASAGAASFVYSQRYGNVRLCPGRKED